MTSALVSCTPTTLKTVYLGRPGSMTQIWCPNSGYSAPLVRAATAHTLAGGGTAVTRRRKTRRTYALAWTGLTPELADPILAFYTGLMGLGPFCLVDPAWRNQQSLDVSTFGQAVGAIVGWATPIGDTQPVFDASLTPFAEASGVARWNSAVNAHVLFEGSNLAGVYTPDLTNAVPYLPDQSNVITVYAKTATSTCSVILKAFGLTAAGSASPVNVAAGAVTLTTSYQRLTVVVPVGAAGWSAAATPYISAALMCNQTSAPVIHVSNAQIQTGPSTADPWVAGLGVPRVVIPDPADSNVDVWWRRNHTLILAEI